MAGILVRPSAMAAEIWPRRTLEMPARMSSE